MIFEFLQRLRLRLAMARRSRRYGTAFAAGVLATLALPPTHVLPVLFVSFPLLLWLVVDADKPRRALWAGWWFGFGFFAAGLYWVSFALLVDAARFGWLIPFAIVGLGGGFAFYPALVAWATRRWLGQNGSALAGVFLLAGLWVVAEWTRAWFLTGFPWNLMGTVWAFSDAALQPAAWIGTYGLGLITVLTALLPGAFGGPEHRPTARVFGVCLIVIMVGWATGWARLPAAPSPVVADVRLRLVQPAINQADKWHTDLRWGHVVDQMSMGAADVADGDKKPTHVIWAETAAPLVLAHEAVARGVIGANTPKGGLTITGAIRTTPRGQVPFQVWNSLHAIAPDGTIRATFDKFHLVPFGEYMPLGGLLGLKKITAGRTDFTAGPGPVTLRLPGLPPVSPLICYEVIFPGEVLDADDRPHWILNLTNDAWYGRTTGPHQHFATARLRAVEEGLGLVRVANSGISGIIDGYGRVTAQLPLGVRGIVDGDLPEPLASPPLYARLGNGLPLGLAVLVCLAGWGVARRRPSGAGDTP